MFGLVPWELALALVVIFLLEIVLFWAASALADVDPMGWGKLVLVVLGVTAISVALVGVIAWYFDKVVKAPLDPEIRPEALMALGLALFASWAIPALLYPV